MMRLANCQFYYIIIISVSGQQLANLNSTNCEFFIHTFNISIIQLLHLKLNINHYSYCVSFVLLYDVYRQVVLYKYYNCLIVSCSTYHSRVLSHFLLLLIIILYYGQVSKPLSQKRAIYFYYCHVFCCCNVIIIRIIYLLIIIIFIQHTHKYYLTIDYQHYELPFCNQTYVYIGTLTRPSATIRCSSDLRGVTNLFRSSYARETHSHPLALHTSFYTSCDRQDRSR